MATNKQTVSLCFGDRICAIKKAFVTRIINHILGFITVKLGWI